MVVATHVWPLAARISLALAQVGFQTATISPTKSLVRKTKVFGAHYTYSAWERLESIVRAIRAWQPDLLVCSDDQAVRHLHCLHARASKQLDGDSRSLVQLIEASLGNPGSFLPAEQKSKFIAIATDAGVRCPRTWIIADKPRLPYPILVKADGTFGGKGVRIVKNEDQARVAIAELTLPAAWPGPLKQIIARSMSNSGLNWGPKRQRTVCLQEQIVGRPANRAVACHNGKVLAGMSVEALETEHELGPASIVRLIEHSEMTAAAAAMVERLQLSGFIGFDFILDSTNRAWLLEMNPRVTPICHLRLADGTNLPATIFSHMTGEAVISKPPIVNAETVVLFPGGLTQSHRSCSLSSVYMSSFHDVPWDEPELVRACINYKLSNSLRKRALTLLQRWATVQPSKWTN
jgi:glutathione synthase/RimK-type ligase-like ATP-grasp enzyme